MARPRRGRPPESHDGDAERWLLTYADMITLLMALFIMLHSMSQLDLAKFAEVAKSVRSEFGGGGMLEGLGGGVDPSMSGVPSPGLAPVIVPTEMSELRQTINSTLGKGKKEQGIEVTGNDNEVRISFPTTQMLFAPGRAELTPEMYALLQRLGKTLQNSALNMRIEGHTCNLPISNSLYRSNWELSADRARNVALYFSRHMVIPTERISYMGFADTRPRAANDSEKHRQLNRRVEIILRHEPRPATGTTVSAGVVTDAARAPQSLTGQPAAEGTARQPEGSIIPPPINLLGNRPASY